MGSKRSLAPAIAARISRDHPKATVLDVFAGMCAVGTALAPQHQLITNDLHHFAGTVAQALFVSRAKIPGPRSSERKRLLRSFHRNARELRRSLSSRLNRERAALIATRKLGKWQELRDFSKQELARRAPARLAGLKGISDYRKRQQRFPYRLFSSYFAGAYFGLQQAIEIDSIRYAIDRAPRRFRAKYLTALLEAASYCAATPGHFAQFLVPKTKSNTKYIARIRTRSVLERFLKSLAEFPTVERPDRFRNRVFREDALTLLQEKPHLLPEKNLVIYADPPYSRAQYSRYYHLLETLILYDYPICKNKGRYRGARFQTDFSRKLGVVEAMESFIKAAAATGAPLYISYPRNGLLKKAGGNLKSLLKSHYTKVRLAAHEPLNHSTLGGAPGAASIEVLEDVYYAGWK
jgi:adenine-specific DNA-methyltransferase